MLSRWRNSIVTAVLLILSLLLGFVQAGQDNEAVTRMGNKTIERVSIARILPPGRVDSQYQFRNL